MSRSVLVAVTHLLGVGHLSRAAALARGLAVAGDRVTLASGGRPAPLVKRDTVDFVQLPPVHCVGADFRTLYGPDGRIASDELFARRRALLLETLHRVRPDVVVTETFPFGRRQLAPEFLALVEAARAQRPRPTILASVRDILNPPSRTAKAEEADETLARFYDGVLVHGEEAVTPLGASWPVSAGLAARLAYTGYVSEDAIEPVQAGPTGEVLVSGGGSAASLPLFDAALGAARIDPALRWRILVGHGVPAERFEDLRCRAPENVTVERARPDFRSLLAGAAVSVSQAGYNTMIDLSHAGAPAVVVPFEEGNEAEQRLRAELFSAADRVTLLRAGDCGAESLAAAVSAALAKGRPALPPLEAGGVAASARVIAERSGAVRAEEQAWAGLDAVLASAGGQTIDLWWRDDDATRPGPALDRLLAMAGTYGAPVALAVIPEAAQPALAERLAGEPAVSVLVHGLRHENRAPAGAKKQEFGFRPIDEQAAEAARGLTLLQELFGARAAPVFVPPWNRVEAALLPRLPAAGFRGISTFGPRSQLFATAGLRVVNTHLDPIDWRGSRSGLPPSMILRTITTCMEAWLQQDASEREPIGLLTHHAVHDAWVWAFLERLLRRLEASRAVRFRCVENVFALSREDIVGKV